MKLTLTFDSIEEFEAFRAAAREEARAAETPQKAAETPAEAPEPAEKETPAPKAKKAAAAAPAAEATPVTIQAVRKALADLNKATGVNRASEIIKEITGKDKLTDTAESDWPAILARAEEELHAD